MKSHSSFYSGKKKYVNQKCFSSWATLPACYRHKYVLTAQLPAVMKNYRHAGNVVMKNCISSVKCRLVCGGGRARRRADRTVGSADRCSFGESSSSPFGFTRRFPRPGGPAGQTPPTALERARPGGHWSSNGWSDPG